MFRLNDFYKRFLIYLIVSFLLLKVANFIVHMPSISTNFDKLPIFFFFFVVIFIYSIRDYLGSIEEIKWKRVEALLFIFIFFMVQFAAGYLLNAFFRFGPDMGQSTLTVFFYIINIINLISALILLPVFFNLDFVVKFYKKYETRILLNLVVFLLAAIFSFYLYQNWPVFSEIASAATVKILPNSSYTMDQVWGTPVLAYKGFRGDIGAPCSGVESLSLFLFVFAALIINNYKKFHLTRTFLFIIVGLFGMFFVNIVRLAVLMWIGGDISKDIAITLFHNDLGWILYLVYILIAIFVFFKIALKKE